MKRFTKIIFTISAAVAISATALAEDSLWQFKPGAQGVDYDSKRGLADHEEIGASLGLEYMYGRWGTELQLFGNDAEVALGDEDIDTLGAAVNQYAYFRPGARFNPYVVLGAGHADFDGTTVSTKETQANAGLGFKHSLSEKIGWWLDVRGVHGFDDSTTDTVLGLGLAFNIGGSNFSGGRKASVAPAAVAIASQAASAAPGDGDRDGVPDDLDVCMDTPPGVAVDSDGCALDSDGDGIADYKDNCPASVSGSKVDNQGCKLKQARVEEIRLDVQFESNSSQLKAGHMGDIQSLASFMQKHTDLNVVLEGHTDSQGDAAYNQALSSKRAERVKSALVTKFGIDSARITTTGFGEEQPIADNGTREGRAKNRRVIAALTKTIVD